MAITNLTLYCAIVEFTRADDAWSAELIRTYGKAACNARYDEKRNTATTALAALYQERDAARIAYDAAWAAQHDKVREIAAADAMGRLAYEADREARPLYHDGTARPQWDRCSEIVRWSWSRNPTPKVPEERAAA